MLTQILPRVHAKDLFVADLDFCTTRFVFGIHRRKAFVLVWMRSNPLVCVEVDKIESHDQWVSVIAFGRFEELPETPGSDDERRLAQERPRRDSETSPELDLCQL